MVMLGGKPMEYEGHILVSNAIPNFGLLEITRNAAVLGLDVDVPEVMDTADPPHGAIAPYVEEIRRSSGGAWAGKVTLVCADNPGPSKIIEVEVRVTDAEGNFRIKSTIINFHDPAGASCG